jgi:hypothetical protein
LVLIKIYAPERSEIMSLLKECTELLHGLIARHQCAKKICWANR